MEKFLFLFICIFLIYQLKFKEKPKSLFFQSYNGQKIDVVYTWVDGKDPDWVAKKTKFTGQPKYDAMYRYENINELKYSLRSIAKYANWVNKIYIVCDDIQKPSFVNEENPKIQIIKHSQIIPNQYLPVFNSVAIEANIHHIPGLQENFLYFNDDMFVGDYITPEDIWCLCYHEVTNYSELKPEDDEWLCNLKNNYLFMKKKYKFNKYVVPWHQAHFCKRSLMYHLEKEFPEEYTHTSSQKLRKSYDQTITCKSFCLPKIQQNYGVYKGIYKMILEINNYFVNPSGNEESSAISAELYKVKNGKYKFFCINNNASFTDLILKFLNEYYNYKCEYEK